MKKMIFKGFAGVIAAVAIAFVLSPVNAKAAGEPPVSLVADFVDYQGETCVYLKNNGSLGNTINALNWSITEHAVNLVNGQVTLDYTENRRAITEPVYINTSKFGRNNPNLVTITVVCPELNYSYTVSITISNDEALYGSFHVITSGSDCLYNGVANETIDGYPMPLGPSAKAAINSLLPVGYMDALEGTLVYNYVPDYVNKSGIVCYNIPEGYRSPYRTFKLMTIGEGGAIGICDDLDINPDTISANVNFNGYAVVLIYSDAANTAISATDNLVVPAANVSSNVADQIYVPLLHYNFEKSVQGPACQNIFNAFTPAGYSLVEQYSLYTNGSSNLYFKNGLVVLNVPAGYTDYKLITVDQNGGVMVLDDLDQFASTATFPVNFAGYACALVAR